MVNSTIVVIVSMLECLLISNSARARQPLDPRHHPLNIMNATRPKGKPRSRRSSHTLGGRGRGECGKAARPRGAPTRLRDLSGQHTRNLGAFHVPLPRPHKLDTPAPAHSSRHFQLEAIDPMFRLGGDRLTGQDTFGLPVCEPCTTNPAPTPATQKQASTASPARQQGTTSS